MTTSKMTVKPRTIVVKDIQWTLLEIQELKDLYSGRPFIELSKKEIRSSALLQKAMRCEVVQAPSMQPGDSGILYLAQVGYDLMAEL